MSPSCSAISCVLDSVAQTAGQSQSEQRVVQTQSLTRHWSGQSARVTADVHQYVAQDNGLGLQVQAAADESDSKHDTASHSAVLHYHYRVH